MNNLSEKAGSVRDIITIVLFCTAIVLPIVILGIPDNFDLPQHLRFARTFNDSLSELSIAPVWETRDNFGFGSVGVRFYPPLLYVSTTFFHLITGSWYDTLWLTILFWMIISCIGVYLLANEWMSTKYSLLAAIIYAVAPYHLTQVYQAFLLAEFAASAILPFCFLFAYRLIRNGTTINILLFATSYSLLILSHIASTMIGSLCLGFFCLILLERKHLLRSIKNFFFAFTVTAAACGFYLVRLVSEVEWVKHNSEKFYGTGFYDYTIYFFPMYISGGEKYVEKLLWAYDLIIIATLMFFIPTLLVTAYRVMPSWNKAKYFYALLGTGTFAFFMLSLPSSPIWDNVTVLQKIQFPWRWLSALSLVVSIVFASSLLSLHQSKNLYKRTSSYILAISIMLILVFDITQLIIPSAAVPRNSFDERVALLDDEAACDCWWPIWAKDKAFDNKDRVTVVGRSVEITDWEGIDKRFTVSSGETADARVAVFNYPYWKADVNGSEAVVNTGDDGTIIIPLSEATSEVVLSFREPFFLIAAKYISATAWALLIIVLIGFALRRPSNPASPNGRSE